MLDLATYWLFNAVCMGAIPKDEQNNRFISRAKSLAMQLNDGTENLSTAQMSHFNTLKWTFSTSCGLDPLE